MAEKFVDKMKYLVGIEKEEEQEDVENIENSRSLNEPEFERYSHKSRIPGFPTKNNMKLVLFEPKSFDESPKIVDHLKSRKPIILNLEKMDGDMARKIFDFVFT